MGGGLALLRNGDRVRIYLKRRTADMRISNEEMAERRRRLQLPEFVSQTPWQELFRQNVGQLSTGMVLEMAVKYQRVVERYSTRATTIDERCRCLKSRVLRDDARGRRRRACSRS